MNLIRNLVKINKTPIKKYNDDEYENESNKPIKNSNQTDDDDDE